jgi:anhydro-N-acetylmuramic acid kinase
MNNLEDNYYSIGLMSGTSMDGVDAALIKTDGQKNIAFIAAATVDYAPEFHTQLKKTERLIQNQNGIFDERQIIPGQNISVHQIIKKSTDYHKQAVQKILSTINKEQYAPWVIGYHGQTFFHQPEQKKSVILGYPQILATTFQIPAVFHFRENDIAHGGQGAPFAPLYHYALCTNANLTPAAVINCGGISNLSFIPNNNENDIQAFDIGPGNTLIDRIVYLKTNGSMLMDKDGMFGKKGTYHHNLLQTLINKSCIKDGFYEKAGTKALDVNDFQIPEEILNLSLEDACATLADFTSYLIAQSITPLNLKHIILAGGGWNNPIILERLHYYVNKIDQKDDLKIKEADAFGFRAQSMEAEIFAYLAVRSIKKLPLSLPNTTNVPYPLTGGIIFQP